MYHVSYNSTTKSLNMLSNPRDLCDVHVFPHDVTVNGRMMHSSTGHCYHESCIKFTEMCQELAQWAVVHWWLSFTVNINHGAGECLFSAYLVTNAYRPLWCQHKSVCIYRIYDLLYIIFLNKSRKNHKFLWIIFIIWGASLTSESSF